MFDNRKILNMDIIKDQYFEGERPLYARHGLRIEHVTIGPGESSLKEGSDIEAENCEFQGKYPFWECRNFSIRNCIFREGGRAALWYSKDIHIKDSKLHGIKALRECANVVIGNSDIISPEFGWSVRGIKMSGSHAESEYFMLRSDHLEFDHVTLKGKYSFQYITDSVFTDCDFDTKDAFWHARNVLVKDSVIKGEYLAWYCENVTFENCTIIGTQPLCYCKGLKLINCRMIDTDLAFEKSEVDANITTFVDSVKNPKSGLIRVPEVGEIIMDDPEAKGEVIVQASR